MIPFMFCSLDTAKAELLEIKKQFGGDWVICRYCYGPIEKYDVVKLSNVLRTDDVIYTGGA